MLLLVQNLSDAAQALYHKDLLQSRYFVTLKLYDQHGIYFRLIMPKSTLNLESISYFLQLTSTLFILKTSAFFHTKLGLDVCPKEG